MGFIVESLMPIINDAEFVYVDYNAIKNLSLNLKDNDFEIRACREDVFIYDSEDTIDFFMLGNTINFAFTEFETGKKYVVNYEGKRWIGDMGMWAGLKRAYDSKIPILDADYLASFTDSDAEIVFRGDIEIPMLEERVEVFNEIGNVLKEKYDGSFTNLVKNSNNRIYNNGNGIVDKLVNDFPSFNDVSQYKGNELKFYKRAQLACAMLYKAMNGNLKLEDIDDLTVFADYEVPRTLRERGVIVYKNGLDEKVDNRVMIERDSKEELEIRAFTIYASDLLISELNRIRDDKVNAAQLDYLLWYKGKNNCKKPHHLVKTIMY